MPEVLLVWVVSMLNVAFYNIPGNADCEAMRPFVLAQSGLRSIMVTDVDVTTIGTEELVEIEVSVVPTVVLREDGIALFWIEGLVSEEFFVDIFDDALLAVGEYRDIGQG